MLWDLFCRVIDNYGDVGVCWRLAADLGERGERVRLWLDDPSPLEWMAPHGAPGVEVQAWTEAPPDPAPGDVVVEAFGCDPPATFVQRMAQRAPAPVWLNLEYLSAEDYVERSHRLPSPQRNGLTKWFFYPGFTPRTGGLLREPGLLAERAAFDAGAWLAAKGLAPAPGERVVSLFCYPSAPLERLLDALAARPTLLLASPGAAQRATPRGAVRVHHLPWLAQREHDRLLWSCHLNFVRGEDSFVRAQWAGVPFVWQLYPQHDGAHAAKLDAFLDRFGAPAALRALQRGWNGLDEAPLALPDDATLAAWRLEALRWRDTLTAEQDLATQILSFVRSAK